jgi:hypothetical protein
MVSPQIEVWIAAALVFVEKIITKTEKSCREPNFKYCKET